MVLIEEAALGGLHLGGLYIVSGDLGMVPDQLLLLGGLHVIMVVLGVGALGASNLPQRLDGTGIV